MRKIILTLVSVCLLVGNVWASDSNIRTGEVEVTATRAKKSGKRSPYVTFCNDRR